MGNGDGRVRLGRTGAPFVVINGEGQEVGVVVAYDQYVRLLALVAGRVGRTGLSAYWRRALDGCLPVEDAVNRTPGPGAIVLEPPQPDAVGGAAVGG